jgi:hypothetical protein
MLSRQETLLDAIGKVRLAGRQPEQARGSG